MSKKIVLFSVPTPTVFEKLKSALFPEYLKEKKFAYMPSDGLDIISNNTYTPIWQKFVEENNSEFIFIDNSKRNQEASKEAEKIISANILLITGGNTFILLNHLKQSKLDKAILEFWKKQNIVLSAFSAGALVLSPTIKIAVFFDKNVPDIIDLSGLNIIDFEVWPHYDKTQDETVKKYQSETSSKVTTIENEEVVVLG